ncbi:MAG: polyphosphate kinase 2 [Pseudomonadota bacterium]
MNSKKDDAKSDKGPRSISKRDYRHDLHALQIELVKLQRHLIKSNERILILFEGRDAAGKDGTIKRIVAHLSPRETRVVALAKPSDHDRASWYFQRYVPYLPADQELVLFNRSWYNRAGVEHVMGFCTDAQHKDFLESAPRFEHMLVRSGIKLLKYYLDITKAEQKRRLKERAKDPLTQWKVSPIDGQALKYWKQYSAARNEMLARTHSPSAPWTLVRADDKHLTRINVIKDLLSRLDYKGKDKSLVQADPRVVFAYDAARLKSKRLAG